MYTLLAIHSILLHSILLYSTLFYSKTLFRGKTRCKHKRTLKTMEIRYITDIIVG